ncbi:MAG: hypothetical protein LBJ74_01950, partial [Heliobacteriaceae bacterium]|nr:hypothetical protein [Heliobacteriaceae bacterium]
MGLSASQARLLSITARITDNELRSQFITNAKMRLAGQSSEASAEYMSALNSTQLLYSSYDANGAKTYEKMTAGLTMTYGPLKNQYGLINNSGQLMVSSLDKDNYEKSTTLIDFLKAYGIEPSTNPKFKEIATNLYGEDYEKFLSRNADGTLQRSADRLLTINADNQVTTAFEAIGGDGSSWEGIGSKTGIINTDTGKIDDFKWALITEPEPMSETDWGTFDSKMQAWYGSVGLPAGVTKNEETLAKSGVFGSLINTLNDYPNWIGTMPGEDARYWEDLGFVFEDPTIMPAITSNS